MSSAESWLNDAEDVFEPCAKNSFLDACPENDRGLAHSSRPPALTASSSEVTMMLKHIPCSVTDELVTSILNERGFEGLFDYVHVPMRRNSSNLGFCFVNFMKEEDALRFQDEFAGFKFPGSNSYKQCHVTLAHVQGREANIQSRHLKRLEEISERLVHATP
eukprot:TRINITY_DN3350_c0_g8_i1.p1 TRINITY_DN3350_c0_g8~~TRINITY_DN3350_c0_g8_i1.p1  ORF type:complete len:162 (-),score=24.25 TRINITY_DN3350_c0_g8_i1:126-611(-)